MTMLRKHIVSAIHTSERCACHRLRSLPSTPTTAKQDKGIRKRNCLSTTAKMVEIQQYKDNGEERNWSNLIKVLLHGVRPSRGTPKTKRDDGAIARFEEKPTAKHLKETYDFQRNRTAKTIGANLSGTNSTQKEQSPIKLRMSLFDKFLQR